VREKRAHVNKIVTGKNTLTIVDAKCSVGELFLCFVGQISFLDVSKRPMKKHRFPFSMLECNHDNPTVTLKKLKKDPKRELLECASFVRVFSRAVFRKHSW
jgi:hypothetical protein